MAATEGVRKKLALVSVYNKEGLTSFSSELEKLGYTIVSTGGTASTLEKEGVSVTKVSDITKFPEILGGRVKTLHPHVCCCSERQSFIFFVWMCTNCVLTKVCLDRFMEAFWRNELLTTFKNWMISISTLLILVCFFLLAKLRVFSFLSSFHSHCLSQSSAIFIRSRKRFAKLESPRKKSLSRLISVELLFSALLRRIIDMCWSFLILLTMLLSLKVYFLQISFAHSLCISLSRKTFLDSFYYYNIKKGADILTFSFEEFEWNSSVLSQEVGIESIPTYGLV